MQLGQNVINSLPFDVNGGFKRHTVVDYAPVTYIDAKTRIYYQAGAATYWGCPKYIVTTFFMGEEPASTNPDIRGYNSGDDWFRELDVASTILRIDGNDWIHSVVHEIDAKHKQFSYKYITIFDTVTVGTAFSGTGLIWMNVDYWYSFDSQFDAPIAEVI